MMAPSDVIVCSLVSFDSSTGTNGGTLPKSHVLFWSSVLNKFNNDIDNADAGTNAITWLKIMLHHFICLDVTMPWCHNQSHITLSVNCLHLATKMVPLMMPLVSQKADISANDFTWWKMLCCTSFRLSQSSECNTISLTWCQCQRCNLTKSNVTPCFDILT